MKKMFLSDYFTTFYLLFAKYDFFDCTKSSKLIMNGSISSVFFPFIKW